MEPHQLSSLESAVWLVLAAGVAAWHQARGAEPSQGTSQQRFGIEMEFGLKRRQNGMCGMGIHMLVLGLP